MQSMVSAFFQVNMGPYMLWYASAVVKCRALLDEKCYKVAISGLNWA